MTVILQTGFVGIEYDLDHPRICWRSMGGTAISGGDAAGYPDTNAIDVRTALAWKPDAPTGWIGADGDAQAISYCGVAGHDLGTQNATVTVERWTGSAWASVIGDTLVTDNEALVFLFTPVTTNQMRLRIVSADAVPRIGHVRFGAVTEMPRRSPYGNTRPISESRTYEYDTLRANNGAFMGQSIVSSSLSFNISVRHLSEAWRAAEWVDFRTYANTQAATFFYADWPLSYPEDVAYAWPGQSVGADRGIPNKRLSIALDMQCEAL